MWRVPLVSLFLFAAFLAHDCFGSGRRFCGAAIVGPSGFIEIDESLAAPAQETVDALAREGLLYAITDQILESRNLGPTHKANWKKIRSAFTQAPDYYDILSEVAFQLLRELSAEPLTSDIAIQRSRELGISTPLYTRAATTLTVSSESDALILLRAIDYRFQNHPDSLIKGIESQHAIFLWNRDIKRTLLPYQALPTRLADRAEVRTFLAPLPQVLREAAGWILLTNEVETENSVGFITYVNEMEGVTPQTLFVETAKLRIEQKITARSMELEVLASQRRETLLERTRALGTAQMNRLVDQSAQLVALYEANDRKIELLTTLATRIQNAEARQRAHLQAESRLPRPETVQSAVELAEKIAAVRQLRTLGGSQPPPMAFFAPPDPLSIKFLKGDLLRNLSGEQSDESRQQLIVILIGGPEKFRAKQEVIELVSHALKAVLESSSLEDEERTNLLMAIHDACSKYPGGFSFDEIRSIRKGMNKIIEDHSVSNDEEDPAGAAPNSLVWLAKLRMASAVADPVEFSSQERDLFKQLVVDGLGTFERETEVDELFAQLSNPNFSWLFEPENFQLAAVKILLEVRRPWSVVEYENDYLGNILSWVLARPTGISAAGAADFISDFERTIKKMLGDEDIQVELRAKIPDLKHWQQLEALTRRPESVDVSMPVAEQTDTEAIQLLLSEIAELQHKLDELQVSDSVRRQLVERERTFHRQLSAALGLWLSALGSERFGPEQESLRATLHRLIVEWGSVRLMRSIQLQVTADFLREIALADERVAATGKSQESYFRNFASIIRSLPWSEQQAASLILGTISLLHRDAAEGNRRFSELARRDLIESCIYNHVAMRLPAFTLETVSRIRASAERKLSVAEQNALFNQPRWRAAVRGENLSSSVQSRIGELESVRERVRGEVEIARQRLAEEKSALNDRK